MERHERSGKTYIRLGPSILKHPIGSVNSLREVGIGQRWKIILAALFSAAAFHIHSLLTH